MADTTPKANPKTTSRTTPAAGKVVLDPDVAAYISFHLFPPPDSGRQGLVVNAGDPGFDEAAAMISRARKQLGV